MNLRHLMFAVSAAAAVGMTGCATTGPGYAGSAPPPASGNCYDCGTVTRIEMVQGTSRVPTGTGAVVGGVVGAVAGKEIADRQTDSEGRKNTAIAAGAVAGALAGNAIQNRTGAGGSYNIYVRMNNGQNTVVSQNDIGGIRQGSYVRVYNGRAWAQ